MIPQKKTILLCLPTFDKGGAERVISRLSLYFESIAIKVIVVVLNSGPSQYVYGGNIIDLRLPIQSKYVGKLLCFVRGSVKIAKIIERVKPDRVISFLEPASLPCMRAVAISHYRPEYWVSIRVSIKSYPMWAIIIMRMLYSRADKIIMQTQEGKKDAIKLLCLGENSFGVIPNPLNSSWFDCPSSWDKRNHKTVLAIGRLVKQKGFDILIKAISMVDDVTLTIIGEGLERENLLSIIVSLDLSDRVFLPGIIQDPLPFLDTAGVFVLSSRYEGFPNVLAEAMARGCAIVATDCPTGPREMITDEVEGLLIPVDDANALAKAINKIISNPALSCNLGNMARLRSGEWAIEKIAGKWIS